MTTNRIPTIACSACRSRMPKTERVWKCACGGYLELMVSDFFRLEDLDRRPRTLWRYREAIGVEDEENIVSLGEGCTPLVDAKFNDLRVKLKLDYLCPTGSFKDRGSSVMISKLKEWEIRDIVEDSSGNAGSSVAAYASAAEISASIFVPDSTSIGKIAQVAMYGARLVRVPGSRENAEMQALMASKTSFYASHNWNPYFLAGMKTAAYEVSEQLNWHVPDWVVAPLGGGSLILGLYLGFQELIDHGLTDAMPRLAGVQAMQYAPVYESWISKKDWVSKIEKRETVAEGIAIAKPVRSKSILDAIRRSNGVVSAVSEEEIWQAFFDLARKGFYVEPTSAAALAALPALRAGGCINPDQRIVIFLTGSGLKATDKVVNHYFRNQQSKRI